MGKGNVRGPRGEFLSEPVSVFGALIAQRRLELNLTQTGAAEKAGIDRTYWSRLERGERQVPAPWIVDQIVTGLEFPPGRAMRVYWAAAIIPPYLRNLEIEEELFHAISRIATADNPRRAIAFVNLAGALSDIVETTFPKP